MVNEGGFANASGAVKKEELRDAVVLHVVVEDVNDVLHYM